MKFTRLAIITVVLSVAIPAVGRAESKWSLKKLMPNFGKKESAPRGLYPSAETPSVWQKRNAGTKNLLAKTKQAVPPWLMPGTQEKVRKSSNGLTESTGRIRRELRLARRNILKPWREKPTQVETPQTVSDFLALPKPE